MIPGFGEPGSERSNSDYKEELDETLIPLRPETDFQKYLFYRGYCKQLEKDLKTCKILVEQLKDEIAEFKYKEELNKQVKSWLPRDGATSVSDMEILSQYKSRLKTLSDRNKQFRDTNRELVHQIVMLKKL